MKALLPVYCRPLGYFVIAIFIILLLYWLLVAEDMKPWLSAMVPSVAQQFFA